MEGPNRKVGGCPCDLIMQGAGPTECKRALTVLQRYYTKVSLENVGYVKRATGDSNRVHVGMVLVKHLLGRPRASRHASALLGVSREFRSCWVDPGAQSHISSGISWGLRIPGTDIWILCFSSCAWRSDASLSSRNRSVVSSPANSCHPKQGEAQVSWMAVSVATNLPFLLPRDSDNPGV